MAEKQYIKHLYEIEGMSLREISRKTGISFQTVKKYAHQEDWNERPISESDTNKYPVLGDYIPTIDEWLFQDKREPRKQHHTVSRIFKRLQTEHDFKGSYSSVKKYVRKKRMAEKHLSEGYLPLAHPECHGQIDFGKFKYYDGLGLSKTGYALTISFPYSNKAYTQAYPSENQECLLTGMKAIFTHISGVPIRLKADNMSTAVSRVLKGTERELTDGFTRFMLHYRFEADFCNPACGNEKGNVENKVGYTRRNFFVPVPIIENFDFFNAELLKLCEEDGNRKHYRQDSTINELWEEECKHLLTLPQYVYEIFRYESARVSKDGYVTVDTNLYGVSPLFAGQISQLKVFYDKVDIYVQHALIKSYKRIYGRNEDVTDWKEYLSILSHKPNALPHTKFFDQIPKLWREHLKTAVGKERKTAITLLAEIVQDGNENLCEEALSMAFECGRTDADSIRQCYYMIAKAEFHPKPIILSANTPVLDYKPNLIVYDSLTGRSEATLPTRPSIQGGMANV